MAELDHSARKMFRATYSPLTSPQKGRPPKRALAKYSLIANLGIRHDELQRLKRRLVIEPPAMLALDTVVNSQVTDSALEQVPLFAEVDWTKLVSVAEALAELREQDLRDFRGTHAAIVEMYPKKQQGRKLVQGAPGAKEGLAAVLDWAVKHKVKSTEAGRFLALLPQLFAAPALVTNEDFEAKAALQA
ncbi:MAG TPA: hypothetical protein VH916_00950, partial [Dehalococcoidia bacterium]